VTSLMKNKLPHHLSSRAVAVLIVQECIESGHSLSSVLPRYLENLKPLQRPLAQEISFGVLRWYYRLNPLLGKMLSKPLRGKKRVVHYILLAGLYQINYLDKADYAIVKETVNTSNELQQSWAKGLVNAVLRRFLREKESLLPPLDQSLATQYAYPKWLIRAIKESWQETAGQEIAGQSDERSLESILEAGNQRPPMTLRLNRQQDPDDYKKRLQEQGIALSGQSEHAHNRHTLILDKPVAVEKLPLFSEGGVSVQDGAAQMAARLLDPRPGERILDACAAPGGKTMHLFEQQTMLEKVIALDVSAERLDRVKENSQRLKIPAEKLELIAADAAKQDWWDGQLFDRILLDAPCSATGVIRRHPDIKVLRRSEDIAALTLLQAQILDNMWSLLKPGGLLLYATCSILRDENDRQMQAFLQRNNRSAHEVPIQADWGRAVPVGRQILPGEQSMDGFYYALLKKTALPGREVSLETAGKA